MEYSTLSCCWYFTNSSKMPRSNGGGVGKEGWGDDVYTSNNRPTDRWFGGNQYVFPSVPTARLNDGGESVSHIYITYICNGSACQQPLLFIIIIPSMAENCVCIDSGFVHPSNLFASVGRQRQNTHIDNLHAMPTLTTCQPNKQRRTI